MKQLPSVISSLKLVLWSTDFKEWYRKALSCEFLLWLLHLCINWIISSWQWKLSATLSRISFCYYFSASFPHETLEHDPDSPKNWLLDSYRWFPKSVLLLAFWHLNQRPVPYVSKRRKSVTQITKWSRNEKSTIHESWASLPHLR